MDIYYKRVTTWKHWPEDEQIESDMVHFSKSKKRFDDNVFLKLDPSVPVPERKKHVAFALIVSPKTINIIKL